MTQVFEDLDQYIEFLRASESRRIAATGLLPPTSPRLRRNWVRTKTSRPYNGCKLHGWKHVTRIHNKAQDTWFHRCRLCRNEYENKRRSLKRRLKGLTRNPPAHVHPGTECDWRETTGGKRYCRANRNRWQRERRSSPPLRVLDKEEE